MEIIMKLEIALAMVENLKQAACVALCIYAVGWFILALFKIDEYSDSQTQRNIKRITMLKKFAPYAFVLFVFTLLPDVNDIWKVRVGLIKLELTDKTNIQAGVEAIERIGKKLECKYIGGCEDKKETKK